MAAMRRLFRTLVILVLVAMMPIRAVAGVAMAFCATGHQEMPAAHAGHGAHADGGHSAHDASDPPAQSDPQRCSIYVEHCSNAAFATAEIRQVSGIAIEEHLPPRVERPAPAFFPDQLDRPPLA